MIRQFSSRLQIDIVKTNHLDRSFLVGHILTRGLENHTAVANQEATRKSRPVLGIRAESACPGKYAKRVIDGWHYPAMIQ